MGLFGGKKESEGGIEADVDVDVVEVDGVPMLFFVVAQDEVDYLNDIYGELECEECGVVTEEPAVRMMLLVEEGKVRRPVYYRGCEACGMVSMEDDPGEVEYAEEMEELERLRSKGGRKRGSGGGKHEGYAEGPVGRGKAGSGKKCSPHDWDLTGIRNGCLVCLSCERHMDLAHEGNRRKLSGVATGLRNRFGGEAVETFWFLVDQSKKGDANYRDGD